MKADPSTIKAFWRRISETERLARRGRLSAAARELAQAAKLAASGADQNTSRRIDLVQRIAAAYDLEMPAPAEGGSGPATAVFGASQVSVVTACRDRNDNLVRVLPSWLACNAVGEVVIVDWTSATPVKDSLREAGLDDTRIRIVRAEQEPRWVLALAFNLGFREAQARFVLKADADILIEPDFFSLNPVPVDGFVAGNWRTAKVDQSYVNGLFYIARDDLMAAGGFNEYITSYGWDDEELYARLVARGLTRTDIAQGCVSHLPHDDHARTQVPQGRDDAPARETLAGEPQFLIRRNRYIANVMPSWDERRPRAQYADVAHSNGVRHVRRTTQDDPRVAPAIQREADLASARELMSWRLGEPCMRLPLDAVEALIDSHAWQALTLTHVRDALPVEDLRPAPAPATGGAALFVDAQHGLGNRLRAIASAAAVARAEARELVIVWRPDAHCDCRFEDLFDYDGEVRDSDHPDASAARGAAVFNYMEIEPGAQKDRPVEAAPGQDIYFRSAFVMNHPAAQWRAENAFLQSLRPVAAVLDLVNSVRTPNDVSLHVRMASGPKYETLPWESPKNWSARSHQLIAEQREKSHVSRFEARLDALIAAGRADTVFIAADLPEIYDRLSARYGERATWLPRKVNDRSLRQLRYGLADALLLGRSRLLLGSTWSSFTELAMRLAPLDVPAEMSGTDF